MQPSSLYVISILSLIFVAGWTLAPIKEGWVDFRQTAKGTSPNRLITAIVCLLGLFINACSLPALLVGGHEASTTFIMISIGILVALCFLKIAWAVSNATYGYFRQIQAARRQDQ